MENRDLAIFTLQDIIERKILFIKKQKGFEINYYKSYDEGSLLALEQMMKDVQLMYEEDFLKKYLLALNKSCKQLKLSKSTNEIISSKLLGYNDSILQIISYINPEIPYTIDNNFT